MPKLRSLAPKVRTLNDLPVRLPQKQADPIYNTPEYKAWRTYVVGRAGYRCEARVSGVGDRCERAGPEHRLFCGHIVEISDGGDPFDVSNGQVLCSSHHNMITNAARAKRHQSSVGSGG